MLLDGSFIRKDGNTDFATSRFNPNQVDWELFNDKATGSHLAPLLYRSIAEHPFGIVPEKTKTHLRNTYNQVLAFNIVIQQVFIDFVGQLNNAQIPVIPLKGIYLSEAVYKDIGLRHLSDIDLLIKTDDLEKICDIFSKQGWEVQVAMVQSQIAGRKFRNAHPCVLIKNKVRIELHTRLYNSGSGIKISTADLWNDTFQEQFLGLEIQQFSNELLLQHLCLHLHKHLMGSEFKIVSFCDIREFLRLKRAVFDWGRFDDYSIKHQCKNQIAEVLHICHTIWKMDIPPNVRKVHSNTQEIESRFWDFMRDTSPKKTSGLEDSFEMLRKKLKLLDSKQEKLQFLMGFVFPKTEFMRERYGISHRIWLLPLYIYRPISVFAKVLTVLFK